MQTQRTFLLVAAILGAMFFFVAPTPATAQDTGTEASFATPTKEAIPINVLIGQSKVITFDRPIGRFSVSNPEIAEAVLVSQQQVLVNGKTFGQVNFIAWDKSTDKFLVFDVYVRTNLSLIDSQIRALFPSDDIRLSQANGSVVISGSVTDSSRVTQVEAVVQAAGFKTVNMLQSPVKNLAQVQLQVRVAEVSRSKMRDYGTSFSTARGNTGTYSNSGAGPSSLNAFNKQDEGLLSTAISPALNLFLLNNSAGVAAMFKALHSRGAVRSLAEPNLIAMNGQQASFLAGGEFPVPMVQGGAERSTVSVVFKEYGVRLNFKPTIIDEDHIRLEMEPEVSTIDYANGVKFDGFIIPGLKTRRARTGIELRDGQSFALAGLLDNSEVQSFSKIPVIGDIPLLGNLFKSKSFQKQETELMFIITANLVKPTSADDLPTMHGVDGLKGESPLGVELKGDGITGVKGYALSDSDPKDTEENTPTLQSTEPKPAAPPPASPAPAPVKGVTLLTPNIPLEKNNPDRAVPAQEAKLVLDN
ncbi:MAG: type II and III secretion system protein family protein [Acidobacteriota bacterium]|nr:type II and III secretion system protein family protein [Acidobacteriota bacterium]